MVSMNICTSEACFELFADARAQQVLKTMWLEKSIFDTYSFLNFSIHFNSSEFRINTGRAVKIHYGNSADLKNEK